MFSQVPDRITLPSHVGESCKPSSLGVIFESSYDAMIVVSPNPEIEIKGCYANGSLFTSFIAIKKRAYSMCGNSVLLDMNAFLGFHSVPELACVTVQILLSYMAGIFSC